MSSSRNKRKRSDLEVTATMATSLPPKRAQESATGTEPPASGKNEGGYDLPNMAEQGTSSSASETHLGGASSAQASLHSFRKAQQNEGVSSGDFFDSAPSQSAATVTVGPVNERQTSVNADKLPPQATDGASEVEPSRKANARIYMAPNSNFQSTEDPESKSQSGRQNRIATFISHRRLLLDRVRSGRSASRGKVLNIARNEAQAAKHASANWGGLSRGNVEAPTKPSLLSEKARDEAEVAAFRKLSRSALQAAKKQRTESSDGMQEKRSSLSLRRGASVGKKMNAALSSLVPDRAGPLLVDATPAAPMQALHAISGGAEKESESPGDQPGPTAQRHSSTAASRYSPHQFTSWPAGKMPKIFQSQAQQDSTVVPNEAISKLPKPASQKTTNSTANSVRQGSSKGGAPGSGQPQHVILPAPFLPANGLTQLSPVLCRKASALREEKRAIQSELSLRMQGRKTKRDVYRLHARDYLSNNILSRTAGENTEKEGNVRTVSSRHQGPPQHLPSRRRTHWDDLLREMAWMATDFSEERKWKATTARTLGCAVLKVGAGIENITGTGGPSHKTEKSKVTSRIELSISEAARTSAVANKASAGSRIATDDTTTCYILPTSDDILQCRKIARSVARVALAVRKSSLSLVHGGGVHLKSCHWHAAESSEIEAITNNVARKSAITTQQEAHKCEEVEISGLSADNHSENQSSSFRRITKAVDSILEVFSSSPRRPPKRKSTSGGKVDGDDFTLTSNQVEIIEFIEKNWGQNRNGAGAILTGLKSSGKTTAVCSLLWKHRSDGAQLVVCSPFRVVRTQPADTFLAQVHSVLQSFTYR